MTEAISHLALPNHRMMARSAPLVTLREQSEPTLPPPANCVEVNVDSLTAWYGDRPAVKNINLTFAAGRVTAFIGPSGCGKSTLLRCLNRLHESITGASIKGKVSIDSRNIYADGSDATLIRRTIGFVSQRPTPFPTMSIGENVLAGLRAGGIKLDKSKKEERIEGALQRVALWDEVKDRLDGNPMGLSGGQQQRLCLARALATEPRVLLLDEPTAALDPASTQRIEELVYSLRNDVTVVLVTHNLQQAARASDKTVFMLNGDLIEMADTGDLFTSPNNPLTEQYVTGRFG